MSPLAIIIQREYFERVKRKSFIITTLLVPFFMVALMVAPALFMLLSGPEERTVQVVDQTGLILPRLHGNGEVVFVGAADEQALRDNPDISTYIIIGAGAVEHPGREIRVFTRGSLSMATETFVRDQINRSIEDIRLDRAGSGDVRRILREVEVHDSYPAIDLDSDGASTSSTIAYILALATDMMLYMFILVYGQMVMNSIIEEKANRVLEIVVSSVKPRTLMLGKILGIGLVAVTQILIWGVILAVASSLLAPLTAGMDGGNAELEASLGVLADSSRMAALFGWMLLFFIGGYLFYSAIYAAIGSAVDNIQDAGQLSSVATIPVIIGIVTSMSAVNNPGSDFAFWVSVIPFTSPMAMMGRLPFGVPLWQILLALGVLYASFMGMIWLCAKIYRIGIFMYGKKPTLLEILRWARYS